MHWQAKSMCEWRWYRFHTFKVRSKYTACYSKLTSGYCCKSSHHNLETGFALLTNPPDKWLPICSVTDVAKRFWTRCSSPGCSETPHNNVSNTDIWCLPTREDQLLLSFCWRVRQGQKVGILDNGSVQCTFDKVGIFKVKINTGFAAGVNDHTQQLETVLSRGNLNWYIPFEASKLGSINLEGS